MGMISVLKTSTCSISVDIQKIQFIKQKSVRKMKDELNGVKIDEFVGLKSKMYSLIADNDKEVHKAKGRNKK